VPTVESIRASLLAWSRSDSNVIALIETGSTSRRDALRDEFSDLDVEVIARDPQRLLDDDGWFAAHGDVWVVLRFDDLRYPTRLVIYDGGAKVDYTVAGPGRLAEMHERLDSLYERGYRVLLDEDGLTDGLPTPTGAFPERAAPTQREFDAAVEEFWFEATHMPRYLARDDLWVVKVRDWTMKQDLLTMLEWHATARSPDPVDVRYIGTRMKEWVDAPTWQQVHDVFGRFDRAGSWRALLTTADLFARVSRETAERCGLTYPARLEADVRSYLWSFAPRTERE
jgi:aminoglycoside 6-adenylyltransferase